MYSNKWVYLCNAILVLDILCYQYWTSNNSARKWYFFNDILLSF